MGEKCEKGEIKPMNKKIFEVEENETISECLQRMSEAGYRPVKRVEKPIFKELKPGSTAKYAPFRQKIIFEGVKMD